MSQRFHTYAAAGTLSGNEIVLLAQPSPTITRTATNISAVASARKFVRASGSWLSDGFVVGQSVKSSGWTGGTANNKHARTITAVSATDMIFAGADGADMVDDAGGESVTVTAWVAVRGVLSDLLAAASIPDAAVIPFGPGTLGDWNSSADPGEVDDALNQLASRVKSNETSIASKANTSYVDAAIAGLSWKQAVRAATTAAGTLASSFENGDSIDGVTLATGNRILVKNQTAAAENGIYTVAASGAPARASDADTGAELVNATVYVSEGTTLADTQWTCTANATPTVGSTSLPWAQLSAGSSDAASVTYTPANNSNWNGSADPGNTNDALDQLASRLKIAESSIAGGTLIAEATVTGSAVTSITFSGLNLSADKAWYISCALKNANSSGVGVRVRPNGDNTDSRYMRNYVIGYNGGVSAGSTNATASIGAMYSSDEMVGVYHVRPDVDGAIRTTLQYGTGNVSSSTEGGFLYQHYNQTANVTSLVFECTTANSFAVGTNIKIYKDR